MSEQPDEISPSEALEAIRKRWQAATEGPWWHDESERCWRLHGVAFRIPATLGIAEQIVNKQILKAPKKDTPYAEYWPDEGDAAFIVNAWEDVRILLAEIDKLKEEKKNGLD